LAVDLHFDEYPSPFEFSEFILWLISSAVEAERQHRHETNRKNPQWADEHFQRTGKWPNVNSGPVQASPEERWDLIDNAMRQGHRGLHAGSSLLLLLVKKRGLRHPLHLPPLTEEVIFHWAEQHYRRTGRWPKYNSGPVADSPQETWSAINFALNNGNRGLPKGMSLAKLLAARAKAHADSPDQVVH
jgi:hypothetical protein